MRCRLFSLAIILLLAASIPVETRERPGPRPDSAQTDPQALLRESQQLLSSARQQGADTKQAEELLRQSQAEMKRGRPDEAAALLARAVEHLRALAPGGKKTAPAAKVSPGAAAPVLIAPFTHHYAGPGGYYATPDEIRQIGRFFNKHKIPGTLFFDGILVDILQHENPQLIEEIKRWNLPLGYHGEETHGPYPVPSDLCAEVYPLREAQGYEGPFSLTSGKNFDEAVRLTTERYTHRLAYTIDAKTRMLDRRAATESDLSRVGGLKLVQQAFGKDVSMIPSHALECAPEGYAFRRLSRFGIDQPAVPTALHALKIFRRQELADELMSIAGTEVSLFWFMGRLTCKGDDAGETGFRLGPLRSTIEGLDRREPRLLMAGCSKLNEREAEDTVRWIEDEFIPANPGSGWVSGETLAGHFEPEKGRPLMTTEVMEIATALRGGWNRRPPDLVTAAGQRLSLCDAFEALAALLAQDGKADVDPVTLHTCYGPVLESGEPRLTEAVSLPRAAIVAAARETLNRMLKAGDEERFVPASVRVADRELNPAEFLSAMTAALLADTQTVSVEPAQAYPPYADALDKLFQVRTARPLCYTKGQLWTVKPACAKGVAGAGAGTAKGKVGAPAAIATAEKAEPLEGRAVRLVFAANLSGHGPCYREAHAGADLYIADFSLDSGKAANLRRLVGNPEAAEWFPSLSPDGKTVVYNASTGERRDSRDEIRAVDLETGKDRQLVTEARFPCFSSDGKSLLYSSQRPPVICRAAYSAEGLGKPRVVADEQQGAERVEDPDGLPDGSGIVFHRKPDRETAAGLAVIGFDGQGYAEITPPIGAGHASVSPDGSAVAFTTSSRGALMIVRRTREGWSGPERVELPEDRDALARRDSRFAGVEEARVSYVEWIAPDLILATVHGSDRSGRFSFARIFLLRLKNGQTVMHDVSAAIEAVAGVSGRDFCTADGREIKEGHELQ